MRPTVEEAQTVVLELDEMWSFVQKKANKRWIWLALCRATRQAVAYAIGDRSEATCRTLWERIPAVYRTGFCYSDFWDAYAVVLPKGQHAAVGKETGQTNHIERFNNTLRQRIGRLVRKTFSFSKNDFMHDLCLKLFLHRYNSSINISIV
jgi:insertion element IS1 protein InsB